MRFYQAFLISLVICLTIIFVFALVGAEYNPYLVQAELMLTLLALSLTGVLTRSKLKSLAAAAAVPIVNLVPRILGVFSPWGLLTELTKPESILSELLSVTTSLSKLTGKVPFGIARAQTLLNQYGWFLDIAFLFTCTLSVAVFVTMLFTTTGRKHITIISLLFNFVIVIFLIFFLLILPLFYYGLATTVEGISYTGIGASHSYNALKELSNPLAPNIDFDYILIELAQASPAFFNAFAAFNKTEANLLAGFALRYFDYDEEFQAVKHFLRAGILLTASEGLGELVLGIKDYRDGLNVIFSLPTFFRSSQSVPSKTTLSDANTDFTIGLGLLQSGLTHFRNGKPNLIKAFEEVQKGVELLTDLKNPYVDQIAKQIPLAKNAITVMIDCCDSIIPLANGTYLLTQALLHIPQNQFVAASKMIRYGRIEIDRSQQVYQEISKNVTKENTLSPVPFIVYALRDLTTFASSFVLAIHQTIDAFRYMSDSLFLLMNVDLTNPASIEWVPIKIKLDFARNNLTQANSALTRAQSDVREFMHTDYGPLSNTFHSVMKTLNESLILLSNIVGDASFLINLMDKLNLAVFYFTQGLDFLQNELYNKATSAFDTSIASIEAAIIYVNEIDFLNESLVTSLDEVLTGLIKISTITREAAQNNQSKPELLEEYKEYLILLDDLFGEGF